VADITVDGTLLITLFGLRSFSLSRFDNPGTGQRRHPLPISPLADDTSLTSADVASLSLVNRRSVTLYLNLTLMRADSSGNVSVVFVRVVFTLFAWKSTTRLPGTHWTPSPSAHCFRHLSVGRSSISFEVALWRVCYVSFMGA
jgi:hypothetical protein